MPLNPPFPVADGPGRPGFVSVLIPSFNRAYVLKGAIESVLNQTYRPIETIVVDDGSTDETRSVVESFGSAVRYIHQANGGLVSARNTGLAAATGEFLAFQDSDDLWTPWKLDVQVALLRRYPDVALTWTDMTAVSETGVVIAEHFLRTMYSSYQSPEVAQALANSGRIGDLTSTCPTDLADCKFQYGDIYSAMFLGNLVHPPTAVMRREHVQTVGGLNPAFDRSGEDYEFFWRVSRCGLGAVVEAPGMLYRIGAADQITSASVNFRYAQGYLNAIRLRLKEDRSGIQLPAWRIRRTFAEAHAWVAEHELATKQGWRAAGSFCKSLANNPFQLRPFLRLPACFVPSQVRDMARNLKRRARLGAGATK